MFRNSTIGATVLLTMLVSVQSASADYMYDPPASKLICTDQWNLKTNLTGQYKELNSSVLGTNYTWPIDIFALAHFTDSDSICSGSHEQKMQEYLKTIATANPKPTLLVRVSTGQRPSVMCINVFKAEKSWEDARNHGSRLLSLSAEKVRNLGSADNYAKSVKQRCDKEAEELLASFKVTK